MVLDKKIQIPALPDLGLKELEITLPDSLMSRTIKIYKVPVAVSDDQYYISSTDIGAAEVVPESRARDTLLLAEYSLNPDGKSTIIYLHKSLHKEVKNA